MDDIQNIEVRKLDKWGVDTKKEEDVYSYRLSIYFDYNQDNHHIQFAKEAPRDRIVSLLEQLSELIKPKKKLK